MIRVLFVCYGNICRSPMAEFIFKDMIEKKGISDEFIVASAATSSEEIYNGVGNPVYPPAREELRRHGISCEGKRAMQLCRADYERYDHIIGMEDVNIRYMLKILGGDPDNKLSKLLDYTDRGGNISDPWYTGDFVTTYNDILEGLEGFLEYLGY